MLYLDSIESGNMSDSIWYFRTKDDCGQYLPDIYDGEIIYTQNKMLYNTFKKNGYNINFLSLALGLQGEMGLYEVFSFFFEGKVQSDYDMVNALFSGYLVDSKWCYCLKVGITFCWFVVSEDKLVKLGKMQFSELVSKYTVGKFIKRLRYCIADSGININKLKFITWGTEEIENEFKNYILNCSYFSEFFGRIEGLQNLNLDSVVKLLSPRPLNQINAEVFVDCLNYSFKDLDIYESDGLLYSGTVYYKDFSSCVSPVINKKNCKYGIILDCEGQLGVDGHLDAGCRELGGLIFCKYNKTLVIIDTFFCDSLLLEETLLQVIDNYNNYAVGRIPVLTFGTSDGIMLTASVNELCSRRGGNKILNTFNFLDCKPFVYNYLQDKEIDGKYTLVNIAKGVGVKPMYPKHNPINDARTLFNILAKILLVTDSFVI